jgi:hypothetical protein
MAGDVTVKVLLSCIAFQLDTREEALQSLEFSHNMLRPLIDVYAVSALGLHQLVGRQLTEQDYVQELLLEMRTQLKMGFAQYGEGSDFIVLDTEDSEQIWAYYHGNVLVSVIINFSKFIKFKLYQLTFCIVT